MKKDKTGTPIGEKVIKMESTVNLIDLGHSVESDSVLSSIWNLYDKSSIGKYATCKMCSKKIMTTGGNTKGLHKHGETHNIKAVKRRFIVSSTDTTTNVPAKRSRFHHLTTCLPLHSILARMTSLDGFSFLSFKKSLDLRKSIDARICVERIRTNLPKSDKTIKKYVMSFGRKCKNLVKEIIQWYIQNGEKFSIDFDKWTSIANKRYLNITLFLKNGRMLNLGLVRIMGHANSENLLNLVKQRLQWYGLDLESQIVSFVTDGASVMKKIGKLAPVEHQLCLAHGIQLAVVDVFYEKRRSTAIQEMEDENYEEIEQDFSDDGEYDEEQSDEEVAEEDQDDANDEEAFDMVMQNSVCTLANAEVQAAIKKIRRLGASFKRSPPNNEKLQRYLQDKLANPLVNKPLKTDCKVKWISLFSMLDRYWEVKDGVDHTLLDVSVPNVKITGKDKFIIWCVLMVLNPVAATVQKMCCRDADLLTCRRALIVLFKVLEKQQSKNLVAKLFIRRLTKRVSERWTLNANALHYLQSGLYKNDYDDFILPDDFQECYENDAPPQLNDDKVNSIFADDNEDEEWQSSNVSEIFAFPHKNEMKKHIINLVTRLNSSAPNSLVEHVGASVDQVPPKKKTFEDLINENPNGTAAPSKIQGKPLSFIVAQEMNALEKGGGRGTYLQMCNEYLRTIKPTSVESERAFSAAAYFCNKIKSMYNDATLDVLCFLRSSFRNDV